MGRKVIALWLSLVMLLGFVVIVIELAPKVTAYTPHDPIRINSNAEFLSMAGSEGWIGNGLPGNPYTIEGYDINGSGYGYCIYIGNTTVFFEIKNSYLHEANGVGSDPYFPNTGVILYNVQEGTITNNTVSWNQWYGIYLSYSDSNTITNNTVSNNDYGIRLRISNSNTIVNNTASSNNNGIWLDFSCNINTITYNTVSNNDYGIYLSYSDGNTINFNNASLNNFRGIHLGVSNGNTIANNTAFSNNDYGIFLSYSDSNIITNNTASIHNVSIKVSYSDSNTVTNNNASLNNLYGISVSSSVSNTVTNNIASNNAVGIDLYRSSSHTLFKNEMVNNGISILGEMLEHWNSHNIDTSNTVNGKPVYYWKNQNSGTVPSGAGQVILVNSNNVVIENQNTSDGTVGILLGFSNNNTIANNTASSNNGDGISLVYYCDSNIIDNNTASSNIGDGIGLYSYCESNTITNNTASSNNREGISLSSYSHGNTISNNNASSNNISGINLNLCRYNTISNNNASNNDYGISLSSSDSNTIINNLISNNEYGISLSSSCDNNNIFHNNIINNNNQSRDYTNMANQWDDGYPLGGNYWSDYLGVDNLKGLNQNILGSDGIGDTPYIIDMDSQDNYPLMMQYTSKRLENYTVLKQGWNLISIPLIQEEQNLSRVLGSIDSWYDTVQRYDVTDIDDRWKHHKVGKPLGNDLFELNETIGFWIHIIQPGDTIFLYNGTQPISNQTIPLHPGWNMVGYPSLTSYNRTEGLNNLTFNDQVDAIWSYDAAIQKCEEMGEPDYFEIGKGYYIHTKSKCEWEVPL